MAFCDVDVQNDIVLSILAQKERHTRYYLSTSPCISGAKPYARHTNNGYEFCFFRFPMATKKNTWVDDHYTERARKEGYLARSIYKLEEIDQKFHIVDPKTTKTVLDIGCAPGSWLQYVIKKLPVTQRHIIGIDLKEVTLEAPGLVLFQGDASDQNSVKDFLSTQQVTKFDLILSDMAPDTIGTADIDAVRSIALIEKTLWIYEQLLAPTGKFAIKVFMGPGFDELIVYCKKTFGAGSIAFCKPKACRKQSKETYIIRK